MHFVKPDDWLPDDHLFDHFLGYFASRDSFQRMHLFIINLIHLQLHPAALSDGSAENYKTYTRRANTDLRTVNRVSSSQC